MIALFVFCFIAFLFVSPSGATAPTPSGPGGPASTGNPILDILRTHSKLFLNGARVFAIVLLTSGMLQFGTHLSDGFTNSSQMAGAFFTMACAIFIFAATEAINVNTGELYFSNIMQLAMLFIRIAGALMFGWGCLQLAMSFGQMSGVAVYKSFLTIAGGLTIIMAASLLTALPTLSVSPGVDLSNVQL